MYSDDDDSGSSDESVGGDVGTGWRGSYEPYGYDGNMEDSAPGSDDLSDQNNSGAGSDDPSGGPPATPVVEPTEYTDKLSELWVQKLKSIVKKRLPPQHSALKLAMELEEVIAQECEDSSGHVDVKKYLKLITNIRQRLSYTRTDLVPAMLSKAYLEKNPTIILDHFRAESENQTKIKRRKKLSEMQKALKGSSGGLTNGAIKGKTGGSASNSASKVAKKASPKCASNHKSSGQARASGAEDDDDVPLSQIQHSKKRSKSQHAGKGSKKAKPAAASGGAQQSCPAEAPKTPALVVSDSSRRPGAVGGRPSEEGATSSSASSSQSSSTSSNHHSPSMGNGKGAVPRPPPAAGTMAPATPVVACPARPLTPNGLADTRPTVPGAPSRPAGAMAVMSAEERKAAQQRREEERQRRVEEAKRKEKARAEELRRQRERAEEEKRRKQLEMQRAEEERKRAIERARAEARERRGAMCRVVTFDDANAVLDQIRKSGIDIYGSNLAVTRKAPPV